MRAQDATRRHSASGGDHFKQDLCALDDELAAEFTNAHPSAHRLRTLVELKSHLRERRVWPSPAQQLCQDKVRWRRRRSSTVQFRPLAAVCISCGRLTGMCWREGVGLTSGFDPPARAPLPIARWTGKPSQQPAPASCHAACRWTRPSSSDASMWQGG
jgi:hypothetical protein